MIQDKNDLAQLPKNNVSFELPEDWIWTNVGEISNKIHYGYTAKSSTEPIGPKMLRITDIKNSAVNWDAVPYCEIGSSKKQKYLLEEDMFELHP